MSTLARLSNSIHTALRSHLWGREAAGPPPMDYWHLSRTPFASLLFLLPILMLYEAGLYFAGQQADQLRNGADLWLRQFFDQMTSLLGLPNAGPFLLPALLVVVLLVWQWRSRSSWQFKADTGLGMASESLLFAFCLLLMAQSQRAFLEQDRWLLQTVPTPSTDLWPQALSYLGAGLYEEVLFRLLLLPALFAIFRLVRLSRHWAIILAVIVSSALFAIAHYIAPTDFFATTNIWHLLQTRYTHSPGEPLGLLFRLAAGFVFALLMLYRGIGITIGAHTAYDLMVGILINS